MTEFMDAVVTTANENEPLAVMNIPVPELDEKDVLVKVAAVAVNPVDAKQRGAAVASNATRVLGFDAVGEVVAVGEKATKFKTGDRIFYAGQLGRVGSNATFQAVNEDLAALAPEKMSDAEAAALPLTFLTAYELLADKFGLDVAENAASGKA